MMALTSRRAAIGSILASPLASVPATASVSPATAPSDLARACDWAIEHYHWINADDEPLDDWPDERLTAEVNRYNAVINRIADEPAQDLHDLMAKARLLLHEWSACWGDSRLEQHERALQTFLREFLACA